MATSLIEKLNQHFPKSNIDFLVRKGNEGLLEEHPYVGDVLVWNKQKSKYSSLLSLMKEVRGRDYDLVVNVQRYASSGLITYFSGAKQTVGFSSNPFSFLFRKRVAHNMGDGTHEIERNQQLIAHLTDSVPLRPKLYPSSKHRENIAAYQNNAYCCIAPTSVWFTKQLPEEKWVELIDGTSISHTIYLLGGKDDALHCERIKQYANRDGVVNLAGKLSFLDSAALMAGAVMNYVNDSAPLHMASAMNTPVTSYFCSTVPSFGFGPLSDHANVEQVNGLSCRPCGLHGKKECPQGHFDCGNLMPMEAKH